MIWQRCKGEQHINAISGTLYRLAESQEQIATRRYVDSLQEQAVLEELIEASKPDYNDFQQHDYLLRSPFRYPPLEHGSRFGRPHEMSVFYGAESVQTTLAEVGYYRFIFFQDITHHPKDLLTSEHTIFSVKYSTVSGIQLHMSPFSQFEETLRHASNYAETQQLGSDMREAGVEAFQYLSARDTNKGICVGLFTAAAFTSLKPLSYSAWQCEVGDKTVAFKQLGQTNVVVFDITQFQVNGVVPIPA